MLSMLELQARVSMGLAASRVISYQLIPAGGETMIDSMSLLVTRQFLLRERSFLVPLRFSETELLLPFLLCPLLLILLALLLLPRVPLLDLRPVLRFAGAQLTVESLELRQASD